MTSTGSEPVEHLDVVIIGAGLSGIGAAHHLQTEAAWADYAIFEARDAIGGTWDLFRYPGIRSDSDMHTLGYPFRPWTGEESIADGQAIREYIRDTATESGIDRRIRFHHRILAADWSTEDARWHLTAHRTDTDQTVELTCSFVFSCSGYYRYDRGYVPDFDAMSDFTGEIVHPQFWPRELDHANKRIIVIGSGATAVTLVPALAATAAHVTMLQRSPSYMGSVPTRNPLAHLVRRVLPANAAATLLRWTNALVAQGMYSASKRRPELVKRIVRKGLVRDLPDGYDIDTHFTPRYDPWDQRFCAVADGDLFRTIREGSVDVVTDHVDAFTTTGIRLRSGTELEADIIVAATGLELLFIGGVELTIDGEKVDPGSKLAYKGMMLEDVPNFAMAVGYANASWTLKSDLTCQYVCRLLNDLRDRGLRQCTPHKTDPSVEVGPLFGLDAGYIRRSADTFPKQGDRYPWQVHQSYVKDYRAMRSNPVDDEAMHFTNPAPAEERVVS